MLLRTRAHRTLAALTSLVAIIALLVGVPIALWVLAGSPLPSGLPALSELGDALTRKGLADSTLITIVAFVGWVAWLQVATSIIVESVSWIRGRPAPHVAFAGPIQPMVRKLIATAALLLSTSNVSAFATSGLALSRSTAAVAAPLEYASVRATPSSPQLPGKGGEAPSANVPKTYRVARYDSLWGLAEQYLGDPLRWRELYELNKGRPQSNGRSLTDPGRLRVGWTLEFPADAVGLDPAPTPPTVDQSPLPATSPPLMVVPALCTPVPVEATTTSTSLAAPSPPSTSTSAMPPRSSVEPSVPVSAPVAPSTNTDELPVPWPLVGGGLAAAGLVTLLTRLRRVQQRRRPTGAKPLPLRPDLEPVERRLRHVADLDAAEFLDLALRAFASGTTNARSGPPQILAVRSSTGRVELLLASPPHSPPKGFVITDSDRGWVTDPDLDVDDLRALAAGAAAPLPSLVCVGELDGEQILIDLEMTGILTVTGTEAGAFLNSIALQLATATWIDHVDVLLVSSASTADIAGASRVRRVPDLRTALDELHAISRSFGEALALSDSTSTLHARFSGYHNDGWIPTILITTEPIARDLLGEVHAIVAGGGRGVAVIARSEQGTTWHADVERGSLRLDPLGFDLAPSLIDAEAAHQIDELLTDAVVGDHFEVVIETDIDQSVAEPLGPYVDPRFEVEVRVLGPVEIDGIAETVERRRAAELIAYLALHPKGATEDRLKTVLWRDKAPTAGTFNTTVTFARTSLGFDSEGNLRFPHYSAAGHTYRLGSCVTTDIARFEARVAHARMCDPAAAIETLESALALVRGAPFAQTRGFEWAYSEQIIASAEATIADASHRLAALCHKAGDHAGATSAAIQGLRACPGDETLYRDRMRACHLAGNLAGVEAAFDELCEVVEALEPYDALHPETVELYHQLRRST